MRSLFVSAVLASTFVLVITHSEVCFDVLALGTSPATAHALAFLCHEHILTATLVLAACALVGIFFGAHYANSYLAERRRHVEIEEKQRADYDGLLEDYMAMVGICSDVMSGIPRPDLAVGSLLVLHPLDVNENTGTTITGELATPSSGTIGNTIVKKGPRARGDSRSLGLAS